MTESLAGIKVLDLSRVLAGPWATQSLGDLGAEIWKIERPGSGDDTRSWGPPWILEPKDGKAGISAYFASANRNKKSLAIDFTSAAGSDLVRQLAAEADILIENFKLGGLAKFGLDYESLSTVNPQLVYCSLTGFGQSGPDAGRAGYDFMIQGMAGLMSVTGEADGMPVKVGVALVDILTGLNATIAILAALRHREQTGIGQHIDMALFDVAVASMANQALNYLASGTPPGLMGNAHPNIVPYQAFATLDGHIILTIGNDSQFTRFCELAGCGELATDPAYQTNEARVKNRDKLCPILAGILLTRSSADWLAACEVHKIPAGPVNRLDQVFASAQAQARALSGDIDGAGGLSIPTVASPLRLSKTPPQTKLPPPLLGADTASLLARLGLPEKEIAKLAEEGVIELGPTRE
jgi:crotonobetainyl-CoA:carnitine CoA-transferase CaiB-like acyl-CoA transferase